MIHTSKSPRGFRAACAVFLSVGIIASAACSSDPVSGSGTTPVATMDAGTPSAFDSGAKPATGLTCASYSWCNSYQVLEYEGRTIPAASGGAIPDGLYRLAYMLKSSGTSGASSFGDYAQRGYLFAGGKVLEIDVFGSVGPYTVSGDSLTMARTKPCDGIKATDRSGTSESSTTPYSVDSSGRLHFYYKDTSGGVPYTSAVVYQRVPTLCTKPSTPISKTVPGDSFSSNVTNTGCAEASNGPANAATCKYVSGG